MSTLTSDARKRLKTLEEFSDLGSGFNIAMRDLDIRGAGNLLGGEQSGFISEIGYDTYQKILEEAIHELKETEYKDLFKEELDKNRLYVRDVQMDFDVEMLLPDTYVNSIQERLGLYTELDKIGTEEGIERFSKRLEDRFGSLPTSVVNLFEALRLRWICKRLGFEKLVYKNQVLKCFFVLNAQSSYYESALFQSILAYVAQNSGKRLLELKQNRQNLILVNNETNALEDCLTFLKELEKHCQSANLEPA